MSDKLYPSLENQYDFHLSEIKRHRDLMQDDIEAFTKKRNQYKTLHKVASGFNIGANTVGVVAGSSSVATLAAGITAPLALPLGCVAVGVVPIAALSSFTMKRYAKEREKYARLLEIANSVFSRINVTISQALRDRILSESEYQKVVGEYDQYRKDLMGIRKQNRTKSSKNSQEEFVKALKQVLDEKQSR